MMRWRREEGGKEEGAVCSDGARSVVDGLGESPTEHCLCAHARVVKLEEAWIRPADGGAGGTAAAIFEPTLSPMANGIAAGMLAYTRTSNRNAAGPSVTCE